MLYQETLEVIFHPLLYLSRLDTCSQTKKKRRVNEKHSGDDRRRISGSVGLPRTHLDEPLCQQVDGLSHSGVVFREKLDDVFWRATCLEIPARKKHGFCHPTGSLMIHVCSQHWPPSAASSDRVALFPFRNVSACCTVG